ncbi:MAG: DUF2911 domain-containing protein [Bacteroidota bacterium]
MKKTLLIVLMSTACLFMDANAQEFPKMDGSPMDIAYYPSRVAFRAFAKTDAEKNAKPIIRVTYSRPQAKGRKVFTDLEKPGNIWRMGANESTEVMFFQDVTIDGKKVAAGRYTMYAQLGENDWTIHFSSDTDGWGHYAYKPEESMVATIKVEKQKTESTVENMSIMFEEADPGAHMIVAWDDTMVRVPIGL